MDADDQLADLAQRCHLLVETLHVVVYFAAEPRDAFAALDLHGRSGYFASRSSAMGAVTPEVITATFGVFEPGFVRTKMDGVWSRLTPVQVQVARQDAVIRTLRRVLGQADVAAHLELARDATTALDANGRPLYAAHAGLAWPADPLLALWHAATLLREHRGDAHVAAMTLAGIHPVDAMILHGHATSTMPFLRETRGWSADAWQRATRRMLENGWLAQGADDAVVTDLGRDVKRRLERQTRAAAMAPWVHLGIEGSTRLAELLAPIRGALLDSDVFPAGSPLKPMG